jgi:CheY-like chemotaxis protein
MGCFRRNLESVFSIDPDSPTRSLQEPPDTVAPVTPERKAHHWNSTRTTDEIIGTILAIGEIPATLDFDCATLRSSGYKVILARSVNRAVALTEETQPDLVLCDLHMQPLNGLDFLEIAKRTPTLRDVPVVIISSTCTLERERRDCLEHGAARFVRRPIQLEALLGEIAETLNATKRGAGHENPNY